MSGYFYMNFEDPRLYPFEDNDFTRLDQVVLETGANSLYFDEIQVVDHCEGYIRRKLDEGYKVIITGSNASLLSRELGSKLTGRHISKELFPFSFSEFCDYKGFSHGPDSLTAYLRTGGFPEYVKSGYDEILGHLFEDILIRDILIRYGVRDIKTLQRLAQYLISNIGKLVTGNKLRKLFEIGATSTVMEYLSHMEVSYLFYFVSKFSYSPKKQLVNPRKVYAIDPGLATVNSGSFSKDTGRKLENLVFLFLRQKYHQVFYFSETSECDFVAFDQKGKLQEVLQVCNTLDRDNLDRELRGLKEALRFFSRKEGYIITLDQTDELKTEGMRIQVVPAHQYLAGPLHD